MERKRLDDYLNVLGLSDSIDKLYKHLCELELQGRFMDDEYKEYLDMIRFASKRCDKYMLKYSLNDPEINDFIQLLADMNNYDEDVLLDFIIKTPNIKIKRFLEHIMELSLIFHQSTNPDEDVEREDGVIIDGYIYDYETGIDILEQSGQQDLADNVRYLQEQSKCEDQMDLFIDDLAVAKVDLETHTFMLYLKDRINEEKIPQIKEELIRMKYQIISNIRSIEKTFLHNPSLDYDLSRFQNKMHRLFEQQPDVYMSYVRANEMLIDNERTELLERNKQEYDDMDDLVHDILLSILLKTKITCLPNESVRDLVIEDSEAAIELSNAKLDKRVLKKSIKLNNKYTIKDRNK